MRTTFVPAVFTAAEVKVGGILSAPAPSRSPFPDVAFTLVMTADVVTVPSPSWPLVLVPEHFTFPLTPVMMQI